MVAAVSLAIGVTASPALADLTPRPDEWWFRAWSVQDKVWPLSEGNGVIVAVLDTGVNAKLPELAGAVLPGTDTTGERTDGRTDTDVHGHGTSTAAEIAGQGGGTTGYVGLSPKAKILPVRVSATDISGSDLEAIAAGIRFAVDHGAKVINMSFGGHSPSFSPSGCSAELRPAISYAIQHDVVLVASAGNSGQGTNIPEQPASCPGVMAVGAVTEASQAWEKTQAQPYVMVAAPGAQLGLVGKDGTYYINSAGTSSAAAFASAAVALIRSHNPSMSARTVVQRLIATAMPVGSKGWNNRTGYGVILIRGAMDPDHYPVPATAPNPVYDAFEKWQASQNAPVPAAPSPAPTHPSSVKATPKTPHSSGWVPVAGGVLLGIVVGGVLLLYSRRTASRRPAAPYPGPYGTGS